METVKFGNFEFGLVGDRVFVRDVTSRHWRLTRISRDEFRDAKRIWDEDQTGICWTFD